jgi:hypothetical protein
MERVGRFLAQSHGCQQPPATGSGVHQEQRTVTAIIDDIVEPPNMSCSADAKSKALDLASDAQLLVAFDNLVEAMGTSTSKVHHLDLEVVRSMIEGAPGSNPTQCAALGSPAADVGDLLAKIILVAIERAHAPDAPPPAAPTWPPAPLSTRSPAHAAADALWCSYVATLSDDQTDLRAAIEELLQLSAGYAGCEILRQTIGGTSVFARLNSERRCRAEKCALSVGRELVLHSTLRKLVTFDGVRTGSQTQTVPASHPEEALSSSELNGLTSSDLLTLLRHRPHLLLSRC